LADPGFVIPDHGTSTVARIFVNDAT